MYAHLAAAGKVLKRLDAELHIIIVVFNPVRYISRYRLFDSFRKHAQDAGARLWVVELAFGERPFECAVEGEPQNILFRTDQELWHKEAMINEAVSRLPPDWKYVAWVDADVTFVNPDWVHETMQQLQHYQIVQMFTHAIDLGPSGEPIDNFQSFAYSHLMKQLGGPPKIGGAKGGYYGRYWHPGFCLTEDTLAVPGGTVHAASKRWFEGDVVVIRTAAGNELTCTPNHPVFAAGVGWKSAATLNVGDNVLSCFPGNLSAVGASGNPQQVPTRIKDIVRTFGQAAGVSRTSVPVRPEYFHGDGGGSEIAIVWTDSFLRRVGEAEFIKEFSQTTFNTVLLSDSFLGEGGFNRSSLYSSANFGSSGSSCLDGIQLPTQAVSSHARAYYYSMLSEPVADYAPVGSQDHTNIVERAPGFVHANSEVDLSLGIPISELVRTHSLRLDEVVYVGKRKFAGHVYNLSTEKEYILAENILTHNCWAYRRSAWDTIGGMLDINIVGGGDHQMAYGLLGRIDETIPTNSHPNYTSVIRNWESHALRLKKNIGAVPSTIVHHWHGRKVSRGYFNRWKILTENKFDPLIDTRKDWQRMWTLTTSKPELRDELRAYFRMRNEDGVENT